MLFQCWKTWLEEVLKISLYVQFVMQQMNLLSIAFSGAIMRELHGLLVLVLINQTRWDSIRLVGGGLILFKVQIILDLKQIH